MHHPVLDFHPTVLRDLQSRTKLVLQIIHQDTKLSLERRLTDNEDRFSNDPASE